MYEDRGTPLEFLVGRAVGLSVTDSASGMQSRDAVTVESAGQHTIACQIRARSISETNKNRGEPNEEPAEADTGRRGATPGGY
jgi:hypothetical protein